MLAYLVLAVMWGAWCAIAGALANDGTVGPLAVTGTISVIVVLWWCVFTISGMP